MAACVRHLLYDTHKHTNPLEFISLVKPGLKASGSFSTGEAEHVTALISTFTCLTLTSQDFHIPCAPLNRQIRWSVKPARKALI